MQPYSDEGTQTTAHSVRTHTGFPFPPFSVRFNQIPRSIPKTKCNFSLSQKPVANRSLVLLAQLSKNPSNALFLQPKLAPSSTALHLQKVLLLSFLLIAANGPRSAWQLYIAQSKAARGNKTLPGAKADEHTSHLGCTAMS